MTIDLDARLRKHLRAAARPVVASDAVLASILERAGAQPDVADEGGVRPVDRSRIRSHRANDAETWFDEFGDRRGAGRSRRDEWSHRVLPRFSGSVVTAAAAVVVVAGGLIVASSRDTDGPAGSDPTTLATAPAAGSDAVVVPPAAVADAPAGVSEPPLDGSGGEFFYDDAELLTRLYTLLDVGTAEEVTASMTGPVPQNEVAVCMGEAGFQYEPEDPMAGRPSLTMSAEDYAAQYGLGILAQHPDVGLYPTIADPNQAYVQSLSDGQRSAYYASREACMVGDNGDELAPFGNAETAAIEQFRGVIEADERVVDATEAWSACMAAAGFDYEDPLQMQASFWAVFASSSGVDLEQMFTEEVAVAVANVPCEAEYRAVYRNVVLDRFDEYKALIQSALDSGEVPDAQGIR